MKDQRKGLLLFPFCSSPPRSAVPCQDAPGIPSSPPENTTHPVSRLGGKVSGPMAMRRALCTWCLFFCSSWLLSISSRRARSARELLSSSCRRRSSCSVRCLDKRIIKIIRKPFVSFFAPKGAAMQEDRFEPTLQPAEPASLSLLPPPCRDASSVAAGTALPPEAVSHTCTPRHTDRPYCHCTRPLIS